MVFEAVEILVALAAHLASVGLLFLHSDCARIWNRSQWVYYRKRPVLILFELLILMTMLERVSRLEPFENGDTYLFVVLETVLVLIGLFAADDGAPEWLDFFGERHLRDVCTSQ